MGHEHKVWLICDKCKLKEETTKAGSYNIEGWSHISIDCWTDHIPYNNDRWEQKFVFCAACNTKEPNKKKLLADQLFKG